MLARTDVQGGVPEPPLPLGKQAAIKRGSSGNLAEMSPRSTHETSPPPTTMAAELHLLLGATKRVFKPRAVKPSDIEESSAGSVDAYPVGKPVSSDTFKAECGEPQGDCGLRHRLSAVSPVAPV